MPNRRETFRNRAAAGAAAAGTAILRPGTKRTNSFRFPKRPKISAVQNSIRRGAKANMPSGTPMTNLPVPRGAPAGAAAKESFPKSGKAVFPGNRKERFPNVRPGQHRAKGNAPFRPGKTPSAMWYGGISIATAIPRKGEGVIASGDRAPRLSGLCEWNHSSFIRYFRA